MVTLICGKAGETEGERSEGKVGAWPQGEGETATRLGDPSSRNGTKALQTKLARVSAKARERATLEGEGQPWREASGNF